MPRFNHLSKCRIRNMNKEERGFIAGLIEADGYICLIKRKKKKSSYKRDFHIVPTIGISNSSVALLKKVKKVIGRGWIYQTRKISKKSGNVIHRKPMHRYSLENLRDIKFLLEQIMGLLVSYKRKRAEIVLEYCNQRISRLQDKGRGDLTPYTEKEIRMVDKVKAIKG